MLATLRKQKGALEILVGTHHALTVLHAAGIFALRTHPGSDPNGWGTTLYLQAFFPGALLRGARIRSCEPIENGIRLCADGPVCRGRSGTAGTWAADLRLWYDPERKRIDGAGSYRLSLEDTVKALALGDLSLLKIASNHLQDVPRQDGTRGDTGDVATVAFSFDGRTVPWDLHDPVQTTFFLPDHAAHASLTCALSGQLYDVDSQAQGFDAMSIARAWKPSLSLTLTTDAAHPLTVFAQRANGLDQEATRRYGRPVRLSEAYWHDNIGITPLVLASDGQEKTFSFGIDMHSEANHPPV